MSFLQIQQQTNLNKDEISYNNIWNYKLITNELTKFAGLQVSDKKCFVNVVWGRILGCFFKDGSIWKKIDLRDYKYDIDIENLKQIITNYGYEKDHICKQILLQMEIRQAWAQCHQLCLQKSPPNLWTFHPFKVQFRSVITW